MERRCQISRRICDESGRCFCGEIADPFGGLGNVRVFSLIFPIVGRREGAEVTARGQLRVWVIPSDDLHACQGAPMWRPREHACEEGLGGEVLTSIGRM